MKKNQCLLLGECSAAIILLLFPTLMHDPYHRPPLEPHLLVHISCLFIIIIFLYTPKGSQCYFNFPSTSSNHWLKITKTVVVTNVDWLLRSQINMVKEAAKNNNWEEGYILYHAFRLFQAGKGWSQVDHSPTSSSPTFPRVSFGISTSSPPGTGSCFVTVRCAFSLRRPNRFKSPQLNDNSDNSILLENTWPVWAVPNFLVGSVPTWVLIDFWNILSELLCPPTQPVKKSLGP